MISIETVAAVGSGALVGGAIGAWVATRGRLTDGAVFGIAAVGSVAWGALERMGLHTVALVTAGALLGWVIAVSLRTVTGRGPGGRGGGGGGGGDVGPAGPGPDGIPEPLPVNDLDLWSEFDRTPAFEPTREPRQLRAEKRS